MSTFESSKVQNAIGAIEDAGQDLPLPAWIDLLSETIEHFQSSLDAARDDLKRQQTRQD